MSKEQSEKAQELFPTFVSAYVEIMAGDLPTDLLFTMRSCFLGHLIMKHRQITKFLESYAADPDREKMENHPEDYDWSEVYFKHAEDCDY